jgi:hypothetical protein
MKTACHYTSVLRILERLHNKHPKYPIGRHLATALDGYGDMFLLTDQEVYHALKEYTAELESDIPHEEEELDKILKEGMHLQMMFTDELLNEREFDE